MSEPSFRHLALDRLTLRLSPASAPLLDSSFEFPSDPAVWLRAGNGTGKTTVLKLLATLRAPAAGRYLIDGVDVTQLSFEELVPYRQLIGYGFEHDGLIASRTIRENLELPFFTRSASDCGDLKARVDAMLERFELSDIQSRRPDGISPGLRKAALVARALIADPAVVFLDEPTLGLDERHRRALSESLAAAFGGGRLKRLFFSTSDEAFARAFTPAVVTIADQKLERVAHLERVARRERIA